jgi:DNA-directed RNA polymerase subunit F
MIRESSSLSIAEVPKYLDETKKEMKDFIKKFAVIDSKNAEELRQKITELNIMKIRESHITKILDIVPSTIEEVNKIFIDTGLNEDEKNKILETTKEYN